MNARVALRAFAVRAEQPQKTSGGGVSHLLRAIACTHRILNNRTALGQVTAPPRDNQICRWYSWKSNKRIISGEVIETQGTKLLITMSTTTFEPERLELKWSSPHN
jgi:hypothetical protein